MEVPRHWRMKKQRYALVGELCPNCNTPNFPPRAVCPHCGGDAGRSLSAQQPMAAQQSLMALEERAQAVNR